MGFLSSALFAVPLDKPNCWVIVTAMKTLALPELRLGKEIPAECMHALARLRDRLHFSTIVHIFHAVWLGSGKNGQRWCGVAGDGGWGTYEWFYWDGKTLETSDCGYGCTDIALKEIINREVE